MNWFRFYAKRAALMLVALPMVYNVNAESKYCLSYDDFMADNWIEIPDVSWTERNLSAKFWWGGSDYKLKTDDSELEKILNKKAFAVMKDSTLLINTNKMALNGYLLGKGYTEARRIRKGKLFFVSAPTDGESQVATAQFWGGMAAAAMVREKQIKKPLCYIVSHGPLDKNGHISVRLVNDTQMGLWLINQQDLYNLYMSEKKESKRIRASHIVPILEQAGILPEGKSF